jgi:hypothetical protein
MDSRWRDGRSVLLVSPRFTYGCPAVLFIVWRVGDQSTAAIHLLGDLGRTSE